jgi:hypothetical protein
VGPAVRPPRALFCRRLRSPARRCRSRRWLVRAAPANATPPGGSGGEPATGEGGSVLAHASVLRQRPCRPRRAACVPSTHPPGHLRGASTGKHGPPGGGIFSFLQLRLMEQLGSQSERLLLLFEFLKSVVVFEFEIFSDVEYSTANLE